jgi:hypothetical protein
MFVSELAHGCSCCLPFFFFSRPIRFCDAFRRYKLSAVDVLRHYYRQAPIQSISYWYKTHLAIASVKHPIRKRFAPRRKTRSDTHIHLFRLFLRNFAHSPSFFCFGCRAGVVASMAPTTTTGSHNSSDAKPDLDVRVTSSNARNKERSLRTELYPHIKCFNSGYLPVSKLHTLYWEESGNATGQAVVFLHGGPGSGTSSGNRRFFDPDFYRIVLFDQGGACHMHAWRRTLPGILSVTWKSFESIYTSRDGRSLVDPGEAPWLWCIHNVILRGSRV